MVIIGDSNYHRMQPLIACVVNTNIFTYGNGGNFIFSTHGYEEISEKRPLVMEIEAKNRPLVMEKW